MTDIAAGRLVDALERVWAGIRRRHRELPEVVVIIGPGDHGKRRKWGHFAPGRWTRASRTSAAAAATERVHEVLLAGESLERDAADTVGTMVHEAAHALAEARGVKDTSRRGVYHNGKYKKIAEELGLDVAKDPRIGWSLTTMRPATIAAYQAEIEALRVAQADARQARRRWGDDEKEKPRKSRSRWRCACAEPRHLSMSKKDAERAATICAACESEFVVEESDDE